MLKETAKFYTCLSENFQNNINVVSNVNNLGICVFNGFKF